MNSRLRIFGVATLVAGAASAAGDAASVRRSGVSGCSEILIRPRLARTGGIVSCGSAGGLFDDLDRGGHSPRGPGEAKETGRPPRGDAGLALRFCQIRS